MMFPVDFRIHSFRNRITVASLEDMKETNDLFARRITGGAHTALGYNCIGVFHMRLQPMKLTVIAGIICIHVDIRAAEEQTSPSR